MNPSILHTETWLSFFGSIAQVSGGLVGLVFVALTFKPDMFGAAGDVGMRRLAGQIFSDFLNVLLVSLVMQVPSPGIRVAGFLGIVGALGSVRVVRSLIEIRRAKSGPVSHGPIRQRMIMSLNGNLALLLACGVAMLGRREDLFWWLVVGGVITLVLSGSRSAWLLVTHGAE